MKNDNKNLGRGLAAFFETSELNSITTDDEEVEVATGKTIVEKVPIHLIDCNPYQPRKIFNNESIEELADSIAENGIIQPLLVQQSTNGRFILIAGERRLRAAKLAGLSEVPCIVNAPLVDKKLLEIAILENVQRADLDVLEEAEGYQKLVDSFGYTQEQLAEKLGKSRAHIANIIRLNLLPDSIKQLVHSGKITFGHARALIGIPNAFEIAQRVVDEGLSVREVEKIIQNQKIKLSSYTDKKGFGEPEESEAKNIESQLQDIFGVPVNLKMRNDKGSIEIKFQSLEELDKILNILS